MMSLVQSAAAHIPYQWAWTAVCCLLSMTSIRPEAYPASLAAFAHCVRHCLSPLNFPQCLEAAAAFVDRGVSDHPERKQVGAPKGCFARGPGPGLFGLARVHCCHRPVSCCAQVLLP